MEILKTRRDVAPPNGYATFLRGNDFSLAVSSIADKYVITSFARSATPPPSGASTVIVSESGSVPILIWMDGTALLWYTEAHGAYLNQYAQHMFENFHAATSISFDGISTAKVSNIAGIFSSCQSLASLDLSRFNTGNVTNMGSMFSGCYALRSLNLSGFNTSRVTRMATMFQYCSGLTSLDLSAFDTSSVTNMGSMFYSCSSLRTIRVSNAFVTDAVTDSALMFKNCTVLVGGAGTAYDSSHTDGTYARIDNPPDSPGYFTRGT